MRRFWARLRAYLRGDLVRPIAVPQADPDAAGAFPSEFDGDGAPLSSAVEQQPSEALTAVVRGLYAYRIRAALAVGDALGVSAADLGIDVSAAAQAIAEGQAPDATTALAIASTLPAGQLPLFYGPDAAKLMAQSGRVPQNWTMPIPLAPGMPILEVVTNRIQRSILSLKAYLTDAVVGPAIDILAEFPLARGFDLEAEYAADEFPAWFDPSWVDASSLVDANGHSRVRAAVSEWVAADCRAFAERVRLVYHLIDLQKEAYIHGDAFLYRVDKIANPDYARDHTRIYPENDIEALQGLNPTAVWVARDVVGQVVKIVLVGQPGVMATDLDPDKVIHLKHRGTAYSTYGVPQTARVFKEIAVKEAYLDAAHAWGQRYALPIKLAKYGVNVRGGQNAGPIATPQMRAELERALAQYDPAAGLTLVTPFYNDFQYVGVESRIGVDIAQEVMEANRRILAGLGVPSAFLFGDWTNYATARIQYSGLMHRLKGVQEALREIGEQRIFAVYCAIRGYVDNAGNVIPVRMRWKRAHLEDDASYMQLIAELAARVPGLLSKETLRETLGFDHGIEEQRFADERDRDARIARDEPPPTTAPRTSSPRPALPVETQEEQPGQSVAPSDDRPDTLDPRPVRARRLRAGLKQAEQRLAQAVAEAQQLVALGAPAREHRRAALAIKQAQALVAAYQARLAEALPTDAADDEE